MGVAIKDEKLVFTTKLCASPCFGCAHIALGIAEQQRRVLTNATAVLDGASVGFAPVGGQDLGPTAQSILGQRHCS